MRLSPRLVGQGQRLSERIGNRQVPKREEAALCPWWHAQSREGAQDICHHQPLSPAIASPGCSAQVCPGLSLAVAQLHPPAGLRACSQPWPALPGLSAGPEPGRARGRAVSAGPLVPGAVQELSEAAQQGGHGAQSPRAAVGTMAAPPALGLP